MSYARTSIGTPDEPSGKDKVDSISYTLLLNTFQITQNYKQPHQKHKQTEKLKPWKFSMGITKTSQTDQGHSEDKRESNEPKRK